MKKTQLLLFALLAIVQFSCVPGRHSDDSFDPSLTLWYEQPANRWAEALPLGNGRIGAMVFGGICEEHIQFNEETLWTGQPHDYAHEGAHEVLDELRQLLWEGKQEEAHELGNKRFMSQPFGQFCYQPFGNLRFSFPGHDSVSAYRRDLRLDRAIASVEYEAGGIRYRRESFVSAPDQALVVRLEASDKESIDFLVGMDSPHERYVTDVEGNEIIIKGRANNYPRELDRIGEPYPESKLRFEARVRVVHEGGELVSEGEGIRIRNADNATLYLVAATSFISYEDISGDPSARCRAYLQDIEAKGYPQIREDHLEEYRAYFDRVELSLGDSELSLRPTDKRLASFNRDEDPSLVSLLFQYGRYLLISSSRPGTQPANLQGIWNDLLSPPWDSKYTININTEMNYWPAEITNLSELSEPLHRLVEDISFTGRNVAREHYDLEGWVTHHNTDLWRGAAPINNSNHGIWVTGGAWLCQHLWWHYQFTGDRDFLSGHAYPVLKEASRFFTGYLVEDPQNPGFLVSGPSNSPEIGGLVMGPTMDHQIIRYLFASTAEAAGILDVDPEFVASLLEMRARISPNRIGKYGQLQEWLEDRDDPENQHRHVSHLWGLHPGDEIHPHTTPELAEACRVTLSHRGDEGTGWSRGWKINFWARLLDGEHTFLILKNLLIPGIDPESGEEEGGLYPNLLCAHPPFQIDGNFGATSGITEMFHQSHLRDDEGAFIQDILPALPSSFADGRVRGLKGRGGFEISMEWEGGALKQVEVASLLGQLLNLRYQGRTISAETAAGEVYRFGLVDFALPE